jgi:hypothetical protein
MIFSSNPNEDCVGNAAANIEDQVGLLRLDLSAHGRESTMVARLLAIRQFASAAIENLETRSFHPVG